jgi:hypothetical protein
VALNPDVVVHVQEQNIAVLARKNGQLMKILELVAVGSIRAFEGGFIMIQFPGTHTFAHRLTVRGNELTVKRRSLPGDIKHSIICPSTGLIHCHRSVTPTEKFHYASTDVYACV